MRPGYTQTDVTHPILGWGVANVGLQHLGRIPNCSEVPDTCFLWYFVQFFFFFCYYAPRSIFFVGAPTLTGDFSAGRSEKRLGFIRWALRILLGIYPGPPRDIAWDLSDGRLGNRLGFFWWPLRRSPSIFGIALGVSEHVPRHFPFKIPGDLDIRSKAMERHVTAERPPSPGGAAEGIRRLSRHALARPGRRPPGALPGHPPR